MEDGVRKAMRPVLVAKTSMHGPDIQVFTREDYLTVVLCYQEAIWLKRVLMAGIANLIKESPGLERRDHEAKMFAGTLRHQLDLFGVPR